MTLYKEWQQLLQNLDETNYKKFVKEYSEGETRIYKDILANHDEVLTGILKDLAAKYEVRPIIFMAFVDGINDSLTVPHDLESVTEDTELEFHIDFKELYKNMYKNNADYLYSLEEWNQVYSTDELEEIYKEYRRSKTIVKEKKPGRNEPCPCGSGKKYKNCCGKNN